MTTDNDKVLYISPKTELERTLNVCTVKELLGFEEVDVSLTGRNTKYTCIKTSQGTHKYVSVYVSVNNLQSFS